MANYTGVVVFQDYEGNKSRMTINDPGGAVSMTLNDMEKFAETMTGYSRARIISYSVTATEFVKDETGGTFSTQSGEHYDRVQQKCRMIYRDTDNGDLVTVSLPAPNDACFDSDQEPTAKFAEDMADAIAAATNRESKDMVYMGGGLISKLPPKKKFNLSGV